MQKILITYVERENTPNYEHVSPNQVGRMRAALERGGFKTEVKLYRPNTVADVVAAPRPDLVFNLVYGWRGRGTKTQENQAESAARLESLGVACTGAAAPAQFIAQDKRATAECLAVAGILSPPVIPVERWTRFRGDAVVKPRFGACHRDVMVVRAGSRRLQEINPDEWLVQEYIDGAEYTVGIIECDGVPMVLPPLRTDFEKRGSAQVMVWPHYKFRFSPAPEVTALLAPYVTRAYRTVGLRDYARIDVRVRGREVIVLDVNALPNLDPQISLLPMAARARGIGYDELVCKVARAAVRRLSS